MKLIDRLLQRWRISKVRPFVSRGARVLDIGCADGELFRCLPEVAEGIGVDPDLPEEVSPCPKAILLKGLFPQALPDQRPFDAITMLAVLEHVPPDGQRDLALACARHLKPGGHLVITVPSPYVDHILLVLRSLRLIDGMALHQHYGYDPRQTATLFAVGGLELIESHRFQLGFNNLFVFKKTGAPSRVSAHREAAQSHGLAASAV